MKARCKTCAYAVPEVIGTANGSSDAPYRCKLDPPKAQAVVVPVGGGGVGIQVLTYYPGVQANDFCSRHTSEVVIH